MMETSYLNWIYLNGYTGTVLLSCQILCRHTYITILDRNTDLLDSIITLQPIRNIQLTFVETMNEQQCYH